MTGRNTIYKASCLTTIFFYLSTIPAYAIFGVGDVVSDPGSYAYYAEQISVAVDQVNEMEKAVNTAEDTLDSIDNMKKSVEDTYDSFTGIYNRGARYVSRYQEIERLFDSNPGTMEGQYKKWMALGNKGVNLTNDGVDLYNDPEKALGASFRDPRHPLYDHLAELDKRYHFRQTALKKSVGQAESIIEGMKGKEGADGKWVPGRIDRAKKLAEDIDKANDPKDAMDLTNAFLAEILIALNDLLKLTAHMAETEGLLNFEGADDEVMKDRVEVINTRDQRAKKRQDALNKKLDDEIEKTRKKSTYSLGEGAI